MGENKVLLVIYFLIISSTKWVWGQSLVHLPEYYNCFDKTVGVVNTSLYNGTQYDNAYLTSDQQGQFYRTKKFDEGIIVYDDQLYSKLQLQYDIYHDEVIAKLPHGLGNIVLQLLKNKIKRFRLDNHEFVKIDSEKLNGISSEGFYEVAVNDPSLIFYIKHKKIKKKYVKDQKVYYKFANQYNYLFSYKEMFYSANTRSDIIKVFPAIKKEIVAYYNNYKAVQKSDINAFMIRLFSHVILPGINK